MAYDTVLAARVRAKLARRRGLVEKQMFGGIGFLLHGNICVGVWKDYLIVRVGPEAYAGSLRKPFVKQFDITGRAMSGWVMVTLEGVGDDTELGNWIQQAVAFVRSLPRK